MSWNFAESQRGNQRFVQSQAKMKTATVSLYQWAGVFVSRAG